MNNRQGVNKGGIMYNTMYGGASQNQMATQG